MRFLKNVLFLFMTTSMFIACSSDDDVTDPVDDLAAPSNVSATINVSEDDTGTVTITPSATGASSFEIFFGDVDNEAATTVTVGQTATNVYEEGTYTARIIAIGSDGQTTEISQAVVVAFEVIAFDGGLIVNGDFEAGAEPWNAGVEAFDGPPATVVTENGNTFYSAMVDNPSPSEPFLVNLSQQGLTIVDGTNYILTFDAWSDRERTILAGIGEASGGFVGAPVDVSLTAELQTITLNLTADGFGGDDIRVFFDSNAEAGLVNIDNVSLVEGGDGSDTPSDDVESLVMLVNGDFEAGAAPWTIGIGPDAAPVVTENGNTFYSINVETATPDAVFNVNVSQIGLSITPNTNYILTFDAWSDADRSIIAGIGLSGGDFSNTSVPVNITAAMATYTLMLTSTGFGDDNSRILFDLAGEVGLVNIDNVTITEGGDGSDTPAGDDGGDDTGDTSLVMLVNGDFEAGAAPWTIGIGPDAAPVVTENGNTFYSVNVETATPDAVFNVNVSQIGLNIVPDTNYILTFDAWSDVDRSIIAGIGLSGGDFSNTSVPVNITATMETYTLMLTSTGFGSDNSRVLFDLAGEVGVVNIDNVTITEGGDGSDTP